MYCPGCRHWNGGSWYEQQLLHCSRCGHVAAGVIQEGLLLPAGRFGGRPIRSMQAHQERDYLDQWLHSGRGRDPHGAEAAVRLAILHHLGWLDRRRQLVLSSPEIGYYQAAPKADRHPPRAAPPDHDPGPTASTYSVRWQQQLQAAWQSLRAREQPLRQRNHRQQAQQQQDRQPVPPRPPVAPVREPELFTLPQPPSWWAQLLQLPAKVNGEMVQTAYRAQSKTAHPDVGGSHARMQRLNEARAAAQAWLSHRAAARAANL